MEETVFLFCSRRQFADWRMENCGNCWKESAAHPGCDLSAALRDALHLEGVVPLNVAERLGYFDVIEDGAVLPGTWTCRELHAKDFPSAQSRFAGRPARPGGSDPSPRPAAGN